MCGRIKLYKKHSNIFIIFQDNKDRILITKTAGSSGLKGNKKKKKNIQAVETIFSHVYPYMRAYNIGTLHVIINTTARKYYFALLRVIRKFGLQVHRYTLRRRIAYNGCRAREKRRV